MHLKYWIETCLKQKKWTIQKLKEEIDKIKQETEHKEHAKKLEKIEEEEIPEIIKKSKIEYENKRFYSIRDRAGIGLSTISRILNLREKSPNDSTIKKLESALGSFRSFLEGDVKSENIKKGICFEEKIKFKKNPEKISKRESFYRCEICQELAGYRHEFFHRIIISTKNDKTPIAWTEESENDEGYPQFELKICKKCRLKFDIDLKKIYSELLTKAMKTLKLKQNDIAFKLKTTQSTVFKLLNNRIEYIEKSLAKEIHKLALGATIDEKKKKFKTPFFTKEFYSNIAKNIEDELTEAAGNIHKAYAEKGNFRAKEGDIQIKVEYKKTFTARIKIGNEEKPDTALVTCDFFIEYILRSIYSLNKRNYKMISFITHYQHNEGHEKNYSHYFNTATLYRANILCLMPIHEIINNDYKKPLSHCQFFYWDKNHFVETSYQYVVGLSYYTRRIMS